MAQDVLYIAQQFEKHGKRLSAGQMFKFKNAIEAVRRADRDATRVAGVVAVTQTVEDETGEVIEEPVILARHGEVPVELAGQ